MKWEYKSVHLMDNRDKVMNGMGLDGWECIDVVVYPGGLLAFFKRKLK